MLDVVFTWVAAVATGGFTTIGDVTLAPAAVMLLVVAMVLGGSAGSTAGGFKLRRAAWLGKAVAGQFRDTWSRGGRLPLRRRGGGPRRGARPGSWRWGTSSASTSRRSWSAPSPCSPSCPGGRTCRRPPSRRRSALSNVGLTSGLTDAGLPGAAKAVLVVLMWLGRLEVFAVLVLLQAPLRRVARQESRPR